MGKDHAVEYGNKYTGRRWMYECIDVTSLEYLDRLCNYCKVLFNFFNIETVMHKVLC